MLTLQEVSFGFEGRPILDRVSLELPVGSITCLLGGNGSGKTTLFNIVTGFLSPSGGFVRFGMVQLVGLAPFRISRLGIARTFQDLRLIGKLSVRENILMALPNHPGERLRGALLPPSLYRDRNSADDRKAESLLQEYFLAEVAEQSASEISYGQQKLLTLACCAALNASLILLDEPVAGISSENRDRIADLLSRLKKAGKTVLVIEHQPDFLERTGDSFLYLQAGRLHQFGTHAELRADPVARRALV